MINHFKAEFYKLRHSKILITILGVCAAVIMVSFALSIGGVERALKARLDGQKDATVSLHCDKTVAVDEVVKVMNIAKDNNYKLILATSPK